VGDSGRALSCCDVARLEISLLSHVIHRLGLGADSVKQALQIVDGTTQTSADPAIRSLAAVTKGVRDCFLSQMRIVPHEGEIAVTYFLECCEQLSFSILSPIALRGASASVVEYWADRLATIFGD